MATYLNLKIGAARRLAYLRGFAESVRRVRVAPHLVRLAPDVP